MSDQPSDRTDTDRLDWLERNLESLYRYSNPQMGGQVFGGSTSNMEARGPNGGPTRLRVYHATLRDAINAGMDWKPTV